MTANPEFPLKDIFVCGLCNKNVTASISSGKKNKYAYYHCRCGATRIAKSKAELMFDDILSNIKPNPHLLRVIRSVVIDVIKKNITKYTKTFEEVDKEVQALLDCPVPKNLYS